MTDQTTDEKQESRVVLPVDPTRRTEIDKQRVPMSARPVPAARDGQAGRGRPGPEGARRHGHDLAAPAVDRVPRGDVMSIFLLLMGLFINAPLEELANGNVTPPVAKAPWYLLGLQELLAYFHPVDLGRARAVPVHPRRGDASCRTSTAANIEAKRPAERKTARRAVQLLCVPRASWSPSSGVFFRGPGYSLVTPFLPFFDNFTNGLHFAL